MMPADNQNYKTYCESYSKNSTSRDVTQRMMAASGSTRGEVRHVNGLVEIGALSSCDSQPELTHSSAEE